MVEFDRIALMAAILASRGRYQIDDNDFDPKYYVKMAYDINGAVRGYRDIKDETINDIDEVEQR